MTVLEPSGETAVPSWAVALVPAPVRSLLRVRRRWVPVAVAVLALMASVAGLVGLFVMLDSRRVPPWSAVTFGVGLVAAIFLWCLAWQLFDDSDSRFRSLYAALARARGDRPDRPDLPASSDDVRLAWIDATRARVTRGGVVLGEVLPGRPVTASLLKRSVLNRPPLVEGDRGPRATGILAADGTRWSLTAADAVAETGGSHRAPGGGADTRGEGVDGLLLDGRRVMEARGWLADADLNWWPLPAPSIDTVRALGDVVWPRVPRHLSDGAVLFLLWRRLATTLLDSARAERDRRDRAANAVANNIL